MCPWFDSWRHHFKAQPLIHILNQGLFLFCISIVVPSKKLFLNVSMSMTHKSSLEKLIRSRSVLLVAFLFGTQLLFSQISSNVSRLEDHPGALSLGVSYGGMLQRNAEFFGLSAEYNRRLNKLPIGLAGSLMWDREEDFDKEKVVETFTAAVTGSYLLGSRFSLGTGLGKNFLDTDNSKGTYEFTDGDWITAVFGGYQLPLSERIALGLSLSLEYNISAKETSVSVDLAFGLGI